MYKIQSFDRDTLGLVGGTISQDLLNAAGSRRDRKGAFNSLKTILKGAKLLAKSEDPCWIGLMCSPVGEVKLCVADVPVPSTEPQETISSVLTRVVDLLKTVQGNPSSPDNGWMLQNSILELSHLKAQESGE